MCTWSWTGGTLEWPLVADSVFHWSLRGHNHNHSRVLYSAAFLSKTRLFPTISTTSFSSNHMAAQLQKCLSFNQILYKLFFLYIAGVFKSRSVYSHGMSASVKNDGSRDSPAFFFLFLRWNVNRWCLCVHLFAIIYLHSLTFVSCIHSALKQPRSLLLNLSTMLIVSLKFTNVAVSEVWCWLCVPCNERSLAHQTVWEEAGGLNLSCSVYGFSSYFKTHCHSSG